MTTVWKVNKMKSKLDKLYKELACLKKAEDKILREIAELEGERCKERFSLCLDCMYRNACLRYGKHLKEML
jgi:cell division protein FtsB